LLEIGESSLKENKFADALHTFERALKIAIDENNHEASVKAHLEMGKILLRNMELEQARDNLKSALEQLGEVKTNSVSSEIYFFLGKSYFLSNEIKKGLKPLKLSLKHIKKDDKPPWKADLHYFLGVIFIEKFSLDQAHENLYKAQKLYQESKNRRGIADTLFQLGNLYYKAEDYKMDISPVFSSIPIPTS